MHHPTKSDQSALFLLHLYDYAVSCIGWGAAVKRIIIIPASEVGHFHSMTVVARGGAIAALLGESDKLRSRAAFDTDDEFYDAAAAGRADLYTFDTVEEATEFAGAKIESLNIKARQIEEAINSAGASLQTKKQPQSDMAEAIVKRLRA